MAEQLPQGHPEREGCWPTLRRLLHMGANAAMDNPELAGRIAGAIHPVARGHVQGIFEEAAAIRARAGQPSEVENPFETPEGQGRTTGGQVVEGSLANPSDKNQ